MAACGNSKIGGKGSENVRTSRQILNLNRNFALCFLASASISSVAAQMLAGYESYVNTSVTVALGYMVFFGIFIVTFYLDNRSRYKEMGRAAVRRELTKIITSMGVGELIYGTVRWFSMYYFLELGTEPFAASLASEALSSAVYMLSVSTFLKAAKTFQRS